VIYECKDTIFNTSNKDVLSMSNNQQSKTISFKMKEDDIKSFVDYLDKNDINKSAFIRRAIKELLKKK
jgi:hypothetical protein